MIIDICSKARRRPSSLAATSCECEHSISHLYIIKTSLQKTVTKTRLNGLALLYTHTVIACDATTVVEEYAQKHPRCLQSITPFTYLAN